MTQCGAALGDSFTHADEVSDDEAWPHRLSVLLGCRVANLGVPGYGEDQAVLKYESARPQGQFVILGLYGEMLRRNFAASWRLYAEQADTLPKPYFVVRGGALHLYSPPEQVDRRAIREHHAEDRYYEQFDVRFPFSLSLARANLFRLAMKSPFSGTPVLQGKRDRLLHPLASAWTVRDSIELSRHLLGRFVSDVIAHGKAPVVVLFPSVDDLGKDHPPYERYVASVRTDHPKACVVDMFLPLKEYQRLNGPVRAPKGHFGADGNRVIAETMHTALRDDCKLIPHKTSRS